MSQLLPCPFCGGEAEHYQPNEDIAVISCLKCNAESGYYDGEDSTTPDDAVKFWNTRTSHPQQDVQGLKQSIAEAAICLLKPNHGICDTIWMEKGNCTLYEHLVSQLDVELTGDIDKDIEALKSYQEGKG